LSTSEAIRLRIRRIYTGVLHTIFNAVAVPIAARFTNRAAYRLSAITIERLGIFIITIKSLLAASFRFAGANSKTVTISV
jgi:hypothetical protein